MSNKNLNAPKLKIFSRFESFHSCYNKSWCCEKVPQSNILYIHCKNKGLLLFCIQSFLSFQIYIAKTKGFCYFCIQSFLSFQIYIEKQRAFVILYTIIFIISNLPSAYIIAEIYNYISRRHIFCRFTDMTRSSADILAHCITYLLRRALVLRLSLRFSNHCVEKLTGQ